VLASGPKMDVGAEAPSGWCLYVEAAASKTMVSGSFTGYICCLYGLGDDLVSLVR
jgi:hypothetical protein